MTHRIWRTALALPAVLVIAAGVPASAFAGTAPAGTASTVTASTDDAYTPTMIILDASGSMATQDAPGPRIDAAKNAVISLVDQLPKGANVGLEVYGTSTGSAASDKPAGCRDIKILAPVAAVDGSKIKSVVSGIKASGYTPIGAALEKAAAALPRTGPRSIVLVSDGIDTCAPPDPCKVAKDLKSQGLDLVVHTVGFRVDDAARSQLSCIASATGGSYSDVAGASGLAKALERRVQSAIKPYSAVGSPIKGTETPAGAPQLQPGQYVDTAATPIGNTPYPQASSKYYTIDVHKGETPYLAATIITPSIPPTGSLLSASLTLSSSDPGACHFQKMAQSLNLLKSIESTTVTLSPGEVGGPDWPQGCPTDGNLRVKVERGGDAFHGQPLAMELLYHAEPAADASGLPGPAAKQPAIAVGSAGAATPMQAGTSFNDAPLLKPGSYADSIVPGESVFVKVHLEWGQRLAYAFHTGVAPGSSGLGAILASSTASSPLRTDLALSETTGTNASTDLGRRPVTLSGSALVPVEYNNRQSPDAGIQAYAIDGDYYVRLKAGLSTTAGQSPAIPYTLQIDVVGSPTQGPSYAAAAGPTDAPSTTPSSKGQSPSSPAASGAPAGNASSATPWVWMGTGFAALLAGAAAWLVFRRRP
ncbi:Ca-activated chloride channel family protein [Arthrobacter silviterrae]|uniref:VWA domain-containing protein n=1 Tax=Arthrobacter silviterrae TaxID=2026658 RepID=A0ABX0DDS7_9MICC|nr:VWA domain-containing protein [Arthrobacter silviterrae]MDQ0277991.1 Ca-activated chloride channel family protein [Arthrobacter silviterrae]NGN83545.1 VWA domain-containing protein [Arthrobacter silviterrae]